MDIQDVLRILKNGAKKPKDDLNDYTKGKRDGQVQAYSHAWTLVKNLEETNQFFLFEGQDLTNNQPFKKLIKAKNRESAIADMEVTYPELKWVMSTEVILNP